MRCTAEGTVTSCHAATLRHAYSGPPLLESLRIRNGWSASTVTSINWQAHGGSLRKQMPRRIHFVKLVHDILPTHSRQNRLDRGTRRCPCCPSPQEDRDHILRCPSAARNQWRHTFLDKLSEACVIHHTYAPLQQLLLEALRRWLDPDQPPHDQVQISPYPVKLHPLIQAQNCIGWRQLFNGRFCQQWGDIQNDYLYQNRHHLPTKKSSGQKWQIAIITVIWEQWYVLWKLRNEDVHGNDTAARATAKKREVSRRLTAIYDQCTHMEPSAQSLLFPDIRTHLEQPPWVIQNWITINGPVFMTSLRTVRTKAIQNVRSIRTYFAPRWGTSGYLHVHYYICWPRSLGGRV